MQADSTKFCQSLDSNGDDNEQPLFTPLEKQLNPKTSVCMHNKFIEFFISCYLAP